MGRLVMQAHCSCRVEVAFPHERKPISYVPLYIRLRENRTEGEVGGTPLGNTCFPASLPTALCLSGRELRLYLREEHSQAFILKKEIQK